MRSIALTGATSMLGVALIKQCILNNVRVYALVRPDSAKMGRIPKSSLVSVIDGDLADLDAVAISDPTIDVFYHIGWAYTDKESRNSPERQELNIRYTLQSVKIAHKFGCGRFVGIGSQAEYGRLTAMVGPDSPANPETAYGIAKYVAGKLSRLECSRLGLEHLWVRVFSVYGVNDNESSLIKSYMSNVCANKPMMLTKCEQMWDYLYEDDAGQALFLIGEKGSSGKLYCLGSGDARPLQYFLHKINKVCNKYYHTATGTLPYDKHQVMYLCADITTLTEDTGWKPQTTFEEGVQKIHEENKHRSPLF